VSLRARDVWSVDDSTLTSEGRREWASELEREMHEDLVDAAVRGVQSRLAGADLTRSERAASEARLAELEAKRAKLAGDP
jgi:hypothetical protein